MEYTRKQLENLTGSEEYKQHMANRAERQLSKSQMYDDDADSEAEIELHSTSRDRLNMTANASLKGASKPTTPLGLIKHTPSTTYAESALKPRGSALN